MELLANRLILLILRFRRPARALVLVLTVLSLNIGHLSTASAVPGSASPESLPCHINMVGDFDMTGTLPAGSQGEKPPCPIMRGALCIGLIAVFPPTSIMAGPVTMARTEPWFYEAALQPHVLSPPQRPPKQA